mmetsp:Transcript_7975/g.12051  ORF Transcript_7975/g.12051 Transcript_7975/m.12051 type:complete len:541 (+) Transcript_7975:450-2072(+)
MDNLENFIEKQDNVIKSKESIIQALRDTNKEAKTVGTEIVSQSEKLPSALHRPSNTELRLEQEALEFENEDKNNPLEPIDEDYDDMMSQSPEMMGHPESPPVPNMPPPIKSSTVEDSKENKENEGENDQNTNNQQVNYARRGKKRNDILKSYLARKSVQDPVKNGDSAPAAKENLAPPPALTVASASSNNSYAPTLNKNISLLSSQIESLPKIRRKLSMRIPLPEDDDKFLGRRALTDESSFSVVPRSTPLKKQVSDVTTATNTTLATEEVEYNRKFALRQQRAGSGDNQSNRPPSNLTDEMGVSNSDLENALEVQQKIRRSMDGQKLSDGKFPATSGYGLSDRDSQEDGDRVYDVQPLDENHLDVKAHHRQLQTEVFDNDDDETVEFGLDEGDREDRALDSLVVNTESCQDVLISLKGCESSTHATTEIAFERSDEKIPRQNDWRRDSDTTEIIDRRPSGAPATKPKPPPRSLSRKDSKKKAPALPPRLASPRGVSSAYPNESEAETIKLKRPVKRPPILKRRVDFEAPTIRRTRGTRN